MFWSVNLKIHIRWFRWLGHQTGLDVLSCMGWNKCWTIVYSVALFGMRLYYFEAEIVYRESTFSLEPDCMDCNPLTYWTDELTGVT